MPRIRPKLNLGLTLGATQTSRSSPTVLASTDISLLQLTASLSVEYRITKVDQIRLSIRGLRSQNSEEGTPTFNEISAQVHFSNGF